MTLNRRSISALLSAAIAMLFTGCGPPTPRGPAMPRDTLRLDTRQNFGNQTGDHPVDPVVSVRQLSFHLSGDDSLPRVIYIHGTPGSATNFDAYIADPVPGLKAIAVDRLGFGDSIPGERPATITDPSGKTIRVPPHAVTSFHEQAAAIVPLLVERQGRYPILVGHSLGGPIVAQIAADYPDRVSGLVILAGSLDPSLEQLHWYNEVAQWWIARPLVNRAMRHANREVLAAKAEEEKLAPLLSKVRCPVIILQGTKDDLVPYANALYTQKMLINSSKVELVSIPGANHFIPWTHADLVRAAVAELRDRK